GIASTIKWVETPADFESALDQGCFDLIISDHTLPGFDGLSALGLARKKHPEVPFIFVSGTIGEELAVDSLKQGATDYVLKDRLSRLVTSIERAMREAHERAERKPAAILNINRDITEKKQIEAQLLRAQRMENIGSLAGGIAHDLNNMLGPILVVGHLLRDKLPSPEDRKILDTATASAQRGADMVKQILTFARGVTSEPMLLQVKHVVGELVKLAQDTFPRSINIRTEIAEGL